MRISTLGIGRAIEVESVLRQALAFLWRREEVDLCRGSESVQEVENDASSSDSSFGPDGAPLAGASCCRLATTLCLSVVLIEGVGFDTFEVVRGGIKHIMAVCLDQMRDHVQGLDKYRYLAEYLG